MQVYPAATPLKNLKGRLCIQILIWPSSPRGISVKIHLQSSKTSLSPFYLQFSLSVPFQDLLNVGRRTFPIGLSIPTRLNRSVAIVFRGSSLLLILAVCA